MSYTILYEKPALKFIQKQPKEQQRRILEAVHALPDSGDIKQLKGHTGLLRLRVGSYRIIYTVDNGRLIVRIIDAGNRGHISLFTIAKNPSAVSSQGVLCSAVCPKEK